MVERSAHGSVRSAAPPRPNLVSTFSVISQSKETMMLKTVLLAMAMLFGPAQGASRHRQLQQLRSAFAFEEVA